jgi:hypothetical protein
MVKDEVLVIVEDSSRTRKVLTTFNSTFLTLIQKENGAEMPSKFHPIALCNVIYKIIVNIIVHFLFASSLYISCISISWKIMCSKKNYTYGRTNKIKRVIIR